MFNEIKENKETRSEILFHGTTAARFNDFLQADGSYKDPSGAPIWLDEQLTIPLTLARNYQEIHSSDAILIIVRSDMLSLNRPQNAIKGNGLMLVPDFWTTMRIPAGAFVTYNVTEDSLKMFTSLEQHIQSMTQLCEPLGTVPSYIRAFS